MKQPGWGSSERHFWKSHHAVRHRQNFAVSALMSLQAKDLVSGIDLQDIRETPFQTVDLQFAVLLPNFQSISLHANIQHFCVQKTARKCSNTNQSSRGHCSVSQWPTWRIRNDSSNMHHVSHFHPFDSHWFCLRLAMEIGLKFQPQCHLHSTVKCSTVERLQDLVQTFVNVTIAEDL